MNSDLRKQQRRYYALLNGAKRGLYAPKMVRMEHVSFFWVSFLYNNIDEHNNRCLLSLRTQLVKGSSCKLQNPNQKQPLRMALGRKLSNNCDARGVRFARGDGKRWEVMFGDEMWDETNSNNNRNDNYRNSQSSMSKLNSAVHCPSARSQDQFNLLHGMNHTHPAAGPWNPCRTSDHIIASGLSSFTGSARFNSSRYRSGNMFGVDMCPLQEGCWICSRGTSAKEGDPERNTNNSTFPHATDILLERAETWRDRLSPIDLSNPLTRAPKAFQRKDWQHFKPEFTQPYRFTYFTDKH